LLSNDDRAELSMIAAVERWRESRRALAIILGERMSPTPAGCLSLYESQDA
jgi:hypothetical protein